MYNIMVLGSGGREHALSWKLSRSPKCRNLYVAPGNAGTAQVATNLPVDIMDFSKVQALVEKYEIDFLVVGPEAPLVAGISDYFKTHAVKVIGPSAEASMLEGSKDFANQFMSDYGIPTAGYKTITHANLQEGIDFINAQSGKIVLKADGLAAGKGVLILDDRNEAIAALKRMLDGQFGKASEKVVIEEFLDGLEFSVFVLTDGEEFVLLPVAKDYKRIGEGDTGLNTGGMGAVSPVPFAGDALMQKVEKNIIIPTIRGLKDRKYDYNGFIFFGLIKVNDEPYVIEYNCRLGDPETEVILPRMDQDLVTLFEGMGSGRLSDIGSPVSNRAAATIMLVSGGYPEHYEKNKPISIDSEQTGQSMLFHAGTKPGENATLTNGGRVMAVTSLAGDIKEAINTSLNSINGIQFENMYYRKDIGFDL